MKRSKQNHYSKYFESNLTSIKNSWKGIKIIISMRSSPTITQTLLTFQNETVDNPKNCSCFKQLFQYYRQKDQS